MNLSQFSIVAPQLSVYTTQLGPSGSSSRYIWSCITWGDFELYGPTGTMVCVRVGGNIGLVASFYPLCEYGRKHKLQFSILSFFWFSSHYRNMLINNAFICHLFIMTAFLVLFMHFVLQLFSLALFLPH